MAENDIQINTTNEALVMMGKNLPNHTTSAQGLAAWVRISNQGNVTTFRTRQAVYRAAAWLLAMSVKAKLPDEEDPAGPVVFGEVLEAVCAQERVELTPLLAYLIDSDEEDSAVEE